MSETTTETFTPPTIRPATIADPAYCEHDQGTNDIEVCNRPATVAVLIAEPPHPAAYGRVRTWGFCTEAHALAEAEALWGCGFHFPKED